MIPSLINHLRHTSQPAIRDKRIYLVCMVIFLLYTAFHLTDLGNRYGYNVHLYIKPFFDALTMTATLAASGYFFVLLANRNPHPLRAYWQLFLLPIKHWRETLNLLLLTAAISVVLSIYTTLKSQLPTLVPFYIDPWLAQIDYVIHFNHMPWELTHALFSSPAASAAINFLYNIWFFIMWCFLITFMCWVSRPQLRMQVLISFCLVWIINGNVAGAILSSVGPCYYNHLYPHLDSFAQLMARLNEHNDLLLAQDNYFNIWAIKTQNDLWQSYLTSASGLGDGISAMPSMHVSIATLIALTMTRCHKYLSWLGWIYVVIIELGSVHLGWHYAVDGYLAIFMTSLLWLAVGKFVAQRKSEQIVASNS